MKNRIIGSLLAVCLLTASCQGVIDSQNTLVINFNDANDAKAKAIWSEPNWFNITSEGLGWDGQPNASRDFCLQTTELAIGLSWRPTQSAHITVELEPLLKSITLPNGQSHTPFPGMMFVRYSPDAKHWSSWQMLTAKGQKDAKYQYNADIGIPQGDRTEYYQYISQYSKIDVPWASDEEAMVKWILERDPNFFAKPPPFIGYAQVRYDASLPANQRLTRCTVTVNWAVGGMHQRPKDEAIYEGRMNSMMPWRYRADKPEQGQQSRQECIKRVAAIVAKIKPGQTRQEIEKYFHIDGGLSLVFENRYVFKDCPFIKIKVEFQLSDPNEHPSNNDEIISISKPYFEDPFYD